MTQAGIFQDFHYLTMDFAEKRMRLPIRREAVVVKDELRALPGKNELHFENARLKLATLHAPGGNNPHGLAEGLVILRLGGSAVPPSMARGEAPS